jgi:hypothetical protein
MLGDKDRDALLLRFAQDQSLRQVGEQLGLSEEAAKKRVARAIDRLRCFFASRRITLTTAAVGSVLGQLLGFLQGKAVFRLFGHCISRTPLGDRAFARGAAVVAPGGRTVDRDDSRVYRCNNREAIARLRKTLRVLECGSPLPLCR